MSAPRYKPMWNHPPIARCIHPSPLGPLLLARQGEHLVGLWFEDQPHIPDWATQAQPSTAAGVLADAARQLDDYFLAQRQTWDLPVRFVAGTVFQQQVWHALTHIPYGQTASYASIAAAIGKPAALRAVGAAIGRNPLGIVLPCHRVVGQRGALTGYTGGLERKQYLLTLEARGR